MVNQRPAAIWAGLVRSGIWCAGRGRCESDKRDVCNVMQISKNLCLSEPFFCDVNSLECFSLDRPAYGSSPRLDCLVRERQRCRSAALASTHGLTFHACISVIIENAGRCVHASRCGRVECISLRALLQFILSDRSTAVATLGRTLRPHSADGGSSRAQAGLCWTASQQGKHRLQKWTVAVMPTALMVAVPFGHTH